MPFMGGSDPVEAIIVARSDGIIVGTSPIDHMLQIWAPSLKITWRAGDGKKGLQRRRDRHSNWG
jgi:nicotinate-nucleotide pyrophosphorylase